jgi:hypothetical protein
VKRFFDVRQSSFDFRDNLDEIIDVEPPAGWTSNNRYASFP